MLSLLWANKEFSDIALIFFEKYQKEHATHSVLDLSAIQSYLFLEESKDVQMVLTVVYFKCQIKCKDKSYRWKIDYKNSFMNFLAFGLWNTFITWNRIFLLMELSQNINLICFILMGDFKGQNNKKFAMKLYVLGMS